MLLVGPLACATRWEGDPEIHGFALDVELSQDNAKWVLRDDLRPRVRTVIEAAAAYWNADPDVVSGWRLRLAEGLVQCGDCSASNGCTTDDDRTVTIASNFYVCIESTPLLHEIGHIVLGDPHHLDLRWLDDDAMREVWDRIHADLAGTPDCGGEPYNRQWQGF